MIEFSGIGIRIEHILKYLPEKKSTHLFYLFGNADVLRKFNLDPSYEIIDYKKPVYSITEFFGHKKMREMDLLDIPHFNVPVLFLQKCIVTIHDIIPYKMWSFNRSFLKRLYIQSVLFLIRKFAKKIISVSQHTKDDLVTEFKFHPDQIHVIYNGIDHEIFKVSLQKKVTHFKQKYDLPPEYFLTVGIGKEHKNLNFVLNALSQYWLKNKLRIPLVLAGGMGQIPDYLQAMTSSYRKFIIPFPKVDYSELPLLYQGAKCLIYPSLYEGFGFPPVEAQSVGCPVLSSNASVLPEILKNSVFYFDPRNEASFLDLFKKVTSKTKILRSKVSPGLKNAKRFDWHKTAEMTLDLYEN
ncbi:MAG: glycosyltransferase family 4 protein [Leptospira sp.]|nr:glycosyltransferase family 4 protein [Leptospira sp.]